MRRCLFCGSFEDSYLSTANRYAGFLVNRVNPFRILLISFLPHRKQISPDKDVNFPCTTAAFTLPPEPAGFVVFCQLAQGLSLVCGFCPSARTFALRLPSDGRSPSRPCLRLVLLVVSPIRNTIGSRTGDFHPIGSRPCRAYTTASTRRGIAALGFGHCRLPAQVIQVVTVLNHTKNLWKDKRRGGIEKIRHIIDQQYFLKLFQCLDIGRQNHDRGVFVESLSDPQGSPNRTLLIPI
jgi:hypothetical protein